MTSATALMHLLQLSDSAFPVGTFSFSNTLETAASTGLVHDAATLDGYTRDLVRQAAFTDGIAALAAHRSRLADDYPGIAAADRAVILCKLNDEARLMTRRMGRKLSELGARILFDPVLERFLGDTVADLTPGTYPVAQALVFAACGVSERDLFLSHQYGAANMILGAALRCLRVSHYDTQRILFDLGAEAEALYDQAREMTLDEMNAFAPQADIMAALHEKGTQRLFMN